MKTQKARTSPSTGIAHLASSALPPLFSVSRVSKCHCEECRFARSVGCDAQARACSEATADVPPEGDGRARTTSFVPLARVIVRAQA